MDRKILHMSYTAIGVFGVICVILFIMSRIIVFNEYENTTYGFKSKYPAGWTVIENKEGVAVVFICPRETDLDVFNETFNVIVQDVPPDMSLDKFTEMAISQLQATLPRAIAIETTEPTMLSGRTAMKFIYAGRDKDSDIKMMHIWTLGGGKAYILTYAATRNDFDKFLPLAKKMFGSFRITE